MACDDYKADRLRYPKGAYLREQSIWAIAIYRIGRRAYADSTPWFSRMISRAAYRLLAKPIETLTGITMPVSAAIGPGLRIWHFGPIVIHADAVIGRNCSLRHGVTIGSRIDGGAAPRLGDFVECGAFAQILGGIEVGSHVKIGALSLVLHDVPSHSTVIGNPARILDTRTQTGARTDPAS